MTSSVTRETSQTRRRRAYEYDDSTTYRVGESRRLASHAPEFPRPGSFSYAKVGEDDVEEFFDVDVSRDFSERARRESQLLRG